MLGLIYKDIVANKKTFLLTLIGFIFLNTWLLVPSMVTDDFIDTLNSFPMLFQGMFVGTTIMTFYFGGMIEDSFMQHDESKKWAYFIYSTENGAKNLVGSKYMLSFIFSMATALFCICCNNLACDLLGDEIPNLQEFVLILFYVQLLLRSISYPFIFAYGTKHGSTVKLVAVLVIVAAGLAYLMFGDMSFFTEHGDEIWDKFFGLFTDIGESWKLSLALYGGCLVVPVIYWLSNKISCKVYMKGVENFER